MMRTSLFIVLFFFPFTLNAAELNQKLYLITENIAATSQVNYTTGTSLAVFPFQAEDQLARKRVDLAVEEILTNNLIKTARFTVLERSSLESVFKEQKLALSGAIESATAVKIGKMSGAKLLVLGSISKLGKSYQINARLVDAESGEVISAQYHEVPVKAFDEDAARFMTFVPEEQKIGVYAAAVTAPGIVKKVPPFNTLGENFTPTNKPSVLKGYGFGLRYWPTRKWMMDFFYFSRLEDKSDRAFDLKQPSLGIGGILPDGKLYAENSYRIILNRVFPGENTNIYLGAGVQRYIMRFSSAKGTSWSDISIPATVEPINQNYKINLPIARIGLEWRPQRRIGVAVFGGYSPQSKSLKMRTFIWDGLGNETVIVVRKVVFPKYSLDTTVALYF